MLSMAEGGEKMKEMNQKNREQQRRFIYKANLKSCPICGATLEQDALVGSSDEFIFDCSGCGDFAISYEFYEDYINQPRIVIDRKKIATYLFWHKAQNMVPCLCEYENTSFTKYHFITTLGIDRWYSKSWTKELGWMLLSWVGRIDF